MSESTMVEQISNELMALLGTGRQVQPFSRRGTSFDLATAYQVVIKVRELRRAAGQNPIGRKIGFTNRSLWSAAGIAAPVWNYVFDTTVENAIGGQAGFPLAGMPEPRIEPELVLHLSSAPTAGMIIDDLVECIDWVAPGFEIAYSIFPNWDFSAADAAAAFGCHGALIIVEKLQLSGSRTKRATMSAFSVELSQNGGTSRRGHARDVLGGPLEALKFLVDELARYPVCDPLRAEEIVTTGTLTEAMPGFTGDTWATEFSDIDLKPLHLHFD